MSQIEGLTPVLPVSDLPQAVRLWSAILGTEPTFVDGDRWAQFDVAGRRLALSGADRIADVAAVMLKVPDLAAARAQATDLGLEAGEVQEGAHEHRCVVTGPDGVPIVLYQPRPRPA
ncbi:MAG TPA: bleomycin resistance protein [Candidatus Dormibacteraeota bacterium]|nr:bleomycin resistance protein [Candidatus Dormibacteraeota bacterium]